MVSSFFFFLFFYSASFKKRNKHVNVHPTSFSGPKQLEQLKESCFTYLDEKYVFYNFISEATRKKKNSVFAHGILS